MSEINTDVQLIKCSMCDRLVPELVIIHDRNRQFCSTSCKDIWSERNDYGDEKWLK